MSSPIDSLPNELLDWIFCLLDLQGLFAGRDVCSLWRKIITNNPELQDQLWLHPKPAKYYATYTIPRLDQPSEFQFHMPASGQPIEKSHDESDVYWRQTVTIGQFSEKYFGVPDLAHQRILDKLDFPVVREIIAKQDLNICTLQFVGDPRDTENLYMGAYRSMLLTQPPSTSIRIKVGFHEIPWEPPCARNRRFRSPFTRDMVRIHSKEIQVENAGGVRLGDIIREVEKAEVQTGGKWDCARSNIQIRGLRCLDDKQLRSLIEEYGTSCESSHTCEAGPKGESPGASIEA